MGIPLKGSRRVLVDGRRFRYLVKEKIISTTLSNKKVLCVTVQEDAAKPGAPLQFQAPYGLEVTAKVIEEEVRRAFRLGWKPEARGKVFDLQ